MRLLKMPAEKIFTKSPGRLACSILALILVLGSSPTLWADDKDKKSGGGRSNGAIIVLIARFQPGGILELINRLIARFRKAPDDSASQGAQNAS